MRVEKRNYVCLSALGGFSKDVVVPVIDELTLCLSSVQSGCICMNMFSF